MSGAQTKNEQGAAPVDDMPTLERPGGPDQPPAPGGSSVAPIDPDEQDDDADWGVEFYMEWEREISTVLHQLTHPLLAPTNRFVGRLENLVGRKLRRAKNDYNQWRSVMPFMASMVSYLLTGSSNAPGNPHVQHTDHNPVVGGVAQNPNTFHLANWNADAAVMCLEYVRALFPWPEMQAKRPRHATYHKRMAVIDRMSVRCYIIEMSWEHLVDRDNITVTVAEFDTAPIVVKFNVDEVTDAFHLLGF